MSAARVSVEAIAEVLWRTGEDGIVPDYTWDEEKIRTPELVTRYEALATAVLACLGEIRDDELAAARTKAVLLNSGWKEMERQLRTATERSLCQKPTHLEWVSLGHGDMDAVSLPKDHCDKCLEEVATTAFAAGREAAAKVPGAFARCTECAREGLRRGCLVCAGRKETLDEIAAAIRALQPGAGKETGT